MVSKLLLLMLVGMSMADEYWLLVDTANHKNAGTSGRITIELQMEDTPSVVFVINGLAKNSAQEFHKTVPGVSTKITCINIVMGSSDAWLPDKIVAWNTNFMGRNEKVYFYNYNDNLWFSEQESEGHVSQTMCKQGYTEYSLDFTTSTSRNADTGSVWANVEITGKKGTTYTGILDDKDNDNFRKGKTDRFSFFGMKDVGKIDCISVRARGSDGWLFSKVVVREQTRKTDEITFYNRGNYWSKMGYADVRLCRDD